MSSSRPPRRASLAAFPLFALALAAPAHAQLSIRSFTIDCGGQVSTGGTLRLTSTIGQPDAGAFFGSASLQLRGGFLTPNLCPADFNSSGVADADDIFAFLNAWFAAGPGNACVAPPTGCPGDWNADGSITADDIFLFLETWFNGCA